jgi:histidine triad (HIT) family protein
MSDCIFCKLANGEIPTATLYEDDEFRVILDAGPATKGHCLILPKAHYADIYEMPEDLLGRAFRLAKKIAVRMTKAMGCDGFNIVQNNKECAGQTVFHFHIHLIPRYQGGDRIVAWNPGTLTDDAREEILEKFRAAGE